ncbi:unnamed protein product [Lactuca virosa]|uniref:Exostosin GT47 domain-containing protein n=1 Tax=Lactuca virosa TaxID=75947 RepID=A0AAU9MK25_9ASTR|nr:unnamed protein product [Lactuca virosa]
MDRYVEDDLQGQKMALATKFIITFTLLSLLFLVLFLSPINQTHNILSSSSLPLPSIFRLLQDDAEPKIKENDITLARIEEQLAKARGKIRKAIVEKSFASSQINGSFIHHGPVYKNPFAFFQSHTEMMKTFKIWTYKEGDVPLMHNGPMKFVYSIEGDFIEEMERKGNPMVAKHPDEAHVFFIPISITKIVHYLFMPDDEPFAFIDRTLQPIVEDYINVIAEKYPFWNRSNGADHFFVSCHDWGPFVSKGNAKLFENFIRVLCNANSSEGFVPSRDVSMSESGIHGYVRKRLFEHWGNNEDNDIQVYNYLPKGENHTEWLTKIIIKSHYVIPYSDVLDWSQFSVQVSVDDIPNLKSILQEIPFSRYLEMQRRLMEVQRHFAVNMPAKYFDVFHMIFHSVWLRRLNVRLLKS